MLEILSSLDGLGWLLVMLGPLLFAQRWLHREIQLILLLLTRRPNLSLGLFSLLFFPGVVLHELSHYIMARLLGVRTGRFSLLPKLVEDGKLRLGYVETAQTDLLRDAVIGMAPLVTGGAAVAYLGLAHLGLYSLGGYLLQTDWDGFWQGVALLPDQPDFWLWFYLTFTVSSTMLPSASDRRAWLPILLALLILVLVAFFAGAGPWMLANIAPWFNQGMRAVAAVFAISLTLHLVLLVPLRLVRGLFMQITGLRLASRAS